MRTLQLFAAAAAAAIITTTLVGCGASPAMRASAPMTDAPGRNADSESYATASSGADDAPSAPPVTAGARGPAPVAPVSYHPGTTAPAPATATPAPVAGKTSGTTVSNGKENGGKDLNAAAVLIMYTGALTMTIDEAAVPGAIDKMVDVAENFGGHLAGRTNTSVTVKVPSGRFRDALAEMEKLGMVTNRSVSAEDVSEEYKDAEVRVANLKATRARIQDFLAKAANVNDMLTLEQQLERVSMEIDRIEGRMRFLRERTALSTITVTITPKPKPVPVIAKDPDPPPPPPPPPPPQPPTAIDLRVKWLDELGSDRLMQVKK